MQIFYITRIDVYFFLAIEVRRDDLRNLEEAIKVLE